MSDNNEELKTLQLLLTLPRDILDRFEPQSPPESINRYIQTAPRRQLQYMLVDVLHRLRTCRDDQADLREDDHGTSKNGEQR